MTTYKYKGYRPYGAGEMFCMDAFLPNDFNGNAVEYILQNVAGARWEDGKLVLTCYELSFVKGE